MKTKVTFEGERGHYDILVNGQRVGHISYHGGEAWISLYTEANKFQGEFAGRFKYGRALTCAKSMIKYLLERCTPAQILGWISVHRGPGSLVDQLGWINPNIWEAMKDSLRRGGEQPDHSIFAHYNLDEAINTQNAGRCL